MPDALRRLGAERRAAEAEHRALGHRRQPRRQQLQVEHDLRAAARQGARHRQADRLPRPVAGARRRRSARSTSWRKARRHHGRRQGSRRTIRIHVIGFAKLIGELIDGLVKVMAFFGIAARRSPPPSSTPTRAACAARRWSSPARSSRWSGSSGSSRSLGFELDPFSILVPFLVFAIGVSHGAQKMNGIMQDIGRGTHKLVAARYTFRRLFLAGLTALLADAVGFAVLMVIDIPVIQELALTASIGVAVLIFTNLLLLPVLLSYTGVSAAAARAQPARGARGDGAARASARCGCCSTASRRGAGRSRAVGVAAVLAVGGFAVSLAAQDRRPRSGRAGAARATRATTATTPTSPPTTRCPPTSSR